MKQRIHILALVALVGLFLPGAARADVDVSGVWEGKGTCKVLDKSQGSVPHKLKKQQVTLTIYDGAAAQSGDSQFLQGHMATIPYGDFYFYGFVFGASVEGKGKDSLVGYYTTTPATGCSFVGDQHVLYATVKKDKMKLEFTSSTSSTRFGKCEFKMKRTPASAPTSPCP